MQVRMRVSLLTNNRRVIIVYSLELFDRRWPNNYAKCSTINAVRFPIASIGKEDGFETLLP
jgi:hypothetical protein